jgi:hypothetical protein
MMVSVKIAKVAATWINVKIITTWGGKNSMV